MQNFLFPCSLRQLTAAKLKRGNMRVLSNAAEDEKIIKL